MKAVYKFLLFTIVLFTNCRSQEVKIREVRKDITINKSTAIFDLFLDSGKVENFISSQILKQSDGNRLRNFYKTRSYRFAWFTTDGLTEHTRAFLNLHNNYIQLTHDTAHVDRKLHERMKSLADDDTLINPSGDETAITELQFTQHFFKYAQHAYAGKVNPEEVQWHIPGKKINAMALLDSLLANKGQNAERWEPLNAQYQLMNAALKRYAVHKKQGGWKTIISEGKKMYRQGDSATVIKQTKQRLAMEGGYQVSDTTSNFSNEFSIAVKKAQKRFGFKQDGMINAALIKVLNVPVEDRIEQILINMERMRWMPREPQVNR
ncbi:MAG: peptidoglycan-binding protein [Chitinophagaceae bacterium]